MGWRGQILQNVAKLGHACSKVWLRLKIFSRQTLEDLEWGGGDLDVSPHEWEWGSAPGQQEAHVLVGSFIGAGNARGLAERLEEVGGISMDATARALEKCAERGDAPCALELAGRVRKKPARRYAEALGIACDEGSVELAKIMLDLAPIDAVGRRHGMTALMRAGYSGSVECARLLIEAGASISALDKSGGTVLDWAASGLCLEVYDMVRAAGGRHGKAAGRALAFSILAGEGAIARLLLEAGTRPARNEELGWLDVSQSVSDALKAAGEATRAVGQKLIISGRGGKPRFYPPAFGALHCAALVGSSAHVQACLSALGRCTAQEIWDVFGDASEGASGSLDSHFPRPEVLAAMSGDMPSLSLLETAAIACGADPVEQATLLKAASDSGLWAPIEKVMARRESSQTDIDGAFQRCAAVGNLEGLRGLAPMARIDAVIEGKSALYVAAEADRPEAVEELIWLGVDVRAESPQDSPVLIAACRGARSSTRAVKALLAAGCDPFRRDASGCLALDWCARNQYAVMGGGGEYEVVLSKDLASLVCEAMSKNPSAAAHIREAMERCSVADDGRVGGLKLIAVFGCQEAVSSMGEWLSVIQEREAMQAVALAGAPQQAGASRL